MPCRPAKPADRMDGLCCGRVTDRQYTLKHACPPNKAADTVGVARRAFRRWTGLAKFTGREPVTDQSDGAPRWSWIVWATSQDSRWPRRQVQPHRIRSALSRGVGQRLSRSCAQVSRIDNERLLIHDSSAVSKLPARRRLPGAPNPPDHGAGRRLLFCAPPSGKTLFHIAPQHIPPWPRPPTDLPTRQSHDCIATGSGCDPKLCQC